MTSVTPVSNEENCNNIRSTFGGSTVVKGFDVSALVDHMELLVGNIHICHHVLPFVLFANTVTDVVALFLLQISLQSAARVSCDGLELRIAVETEKTRSYEKG